MCFLLKEETSVCYQTEGFNFFNQRWRNIWQSCKYINIYIYIINIYKPKKDILKIWHCVKGSILYLQADTDLRIFIEKEHLRDYFKYCICLSKKIFCLKCLSVFVFFCKWRFTIYKCVLKKRKKKNKKKSCGRKNVFCSSFRFVYNVSYGAFSMEVFNDGWASAPSLSEV